MTRYALIDRPEFKYGDMVAVDIAALSPGLETYGVQKGKIVGKAVSGVIDQWMIEFDFDWPSYPYKVVAIPHVFIIKEE